MRYTALSLGLLILSLSFCSSPNKSTTDDGDSKTTIPFVDKIESYHKKADFLEKKAISFDIKVTFGGKERLKGTFYTTADGSKIVLKTDQSLVYYDGKEVFASADTELKKPRFDVLTWSYFFLAPYKFSDPGTRWTKAPHHIHDGDSVAAMKLSFEANTGDAPDDWYVTYASENGQLLAMAYIVTYSKSKEKAEEEPHAIRYTDYVEIDNIPIARHWIFTHWNKKDGFGTQIGEVSIQNISFISENNAAFELDPKELVPVALP